jgi:hypothetical protein
MRSRWRSRLSALERDAMPIDQLQALFVEEAKK